MKSFVVFLTAVCLAAVNGESAALKSNQQVAKNQAGKSTDLQTANTHEKVRITQARELHANVLANPNHLEKSFQQIQFQKAQSFDQDFSPQLQSLDQASHQQQLSRALDRTVDEGRGVQAHQMHKAQLQGETLEDQFMNRNRAYRGQGAGHPNGPTQQQFNDQERNQRRHSGNQAHQYSLNNQDAQLTTYGSTVPQERVFPSHQDQTQFMTSSRSDFPQDQAVYGTFRNSGGRQALVASSRVRVNDIPREHHLQYSSSLSDQDDSFRRMLVNQGRLHGQQAGFEVSSAFGRGVQPIQSPGMSHQSSSMLVSGLRNLPSLPALVYSTGVPSSQQALAYGQPWTQGGAYIRQHWQTPYARYVYSHIL